MKNTFLQVLLVRILVLLHITWVVVCNTAVLLDREQTPGIGMPLFSKDGGEKYRCCTCAVLRCYRFTTLSDVAKRKIKRDNTVSKKSAFGIKSAPNY